MFVSTHTGLRLSTLFINLIFKRFMYSSLSVKEQFPVLFSERNLKWKKMVKIMNSILYNKKVKSKLFWCGYASDLIILKRLKFKFPFPSYVYLSLCIPIYLHIHVCKFVKWVSVFIQSKILIFLYILQVLFNTIINGCLQVRISKHYNSNTTISKYH